MRERAGVARMAVGDADAGFTELEEASRMDEGGIQADLALVVGHLRRGDAEKALAAQAELERKQPDNALVHKSARRADAGHAQHPYCVQRSKKALAKQPTYLSRRGQPGAARSGRAPSRDGHRAHQGGGRSRPQSVEVLLTLARDAASHRRRADRGCSERWSVPGAVSPAGPPRRSGNHPAPSAEQGSLRELLQVAQTRDRASERSARSRALRARSSPQGQPASDFRAQSAGRAIARVAASARGAGGCIVR